MSAQRSGTCDPTEPGYDAVLLAGFGGPEAPDEVMPFLRRVTQGRGVPEERLVAVAQHYHALDGASPINAQNRALRLALATELERRGIAIPVLWGNRNSQPFLADVVARAQADGHVRLLGLATSAYSSYSSCRQYREDFAAALIEARLVGSVRIDKLRAYCDQPGFLSPTVDEVTTALDAAAADGLGPYELELIFTTHSIPSAMAASAGSAAHGDHHGDGLYVEQHLAACRAVMEQVAEERNALPSWQLAYQSRSGSPSMPWLEPDVNDAIANVANERRGVIVVPIGFVSDHVEVVWDLDHEASETAAKHDLWFRRVATPGTHPDFVAVLADLVTERLDPTAAPESVASVRRPDVCPAGCCVNSRATKPTVAGADSVLDWAGTEIDSALLAASGISQTAT